MFLSRLQNSHLVIAVFAVAGAVFEFSRGNWGAGFASIICGALGIVFRDEVARWAERWFNWIVAIFILIVGIALLAEDFIRFFS